jgi:hypothetical protein
VIASTAPVTPPTDAAVDAQREGDGQRGAAEPPPSLFDAQPTAGRVRATDPTTSVTAARKAKVAAQRHLIACLLARYDYVTADDVWAADLRDCRPDRGSYSTRLGGLVKDGLLRKGGPVPRLSPRGERRSVITYWPTPKGSEWVRSLTSELVG